MPVRWAEAHCAWGSGERARPCIHHPHHLSIGAKCRPGMSWMWDSGSFHVVPSWSLRAGAGGCGPRWGRAQGSSVLAAEGLALGASNIGYFLLFSFRK